MTKGNASTKYCYIQPTGYHEKLYNFEKACRREKLKRHSTWFDIRPDEKPFQMKLSKTHNNVQKTETRDYSREYISKTDPKYLPRNFNKIFENLYSFDFTEDERLNSRNAPVKKPPKQNERLDGGGSIFDNLVGFFNVQGTVPRHPNETPSPYKKEVRHDHDLCSCSDSDQEIREEPKPNPPNHKQKCESRAIAKFEPRGRSMADGRSDFVDEQGTSTAFLYEFNERRLPKQVPIIVLSQYNNGVRQVDSTDSVQPTQCCTIKSKKHNRIKTEEPKLMPLSDVLGELEVLENEEKEMCKRLARLDFAMAKIGKELSAVHSTYSHLERFRQLEQKFHDLHSSLGELKMEYCSGVKRADASIKYEQRRMEPQTKMKENNLKQNNSSSSVNSCEDSDEGSSKFCCKKKKRSKNKKCKDQEECCFDNYEESRKMRQSPNSSCYQCKHSENTSPKTKSVKPCACGGPDPKRPDVCCQCQHLEVEVKGNDRNTCNCGTFPDVNHCTPCKGKVVCKNLCKEIYKAVENISICDLALTIVQCNDGVFQINVVTLEEPKRVACIKATKQAIEEAKEIGIFDYFLTFFLTDARIKDAQQECHCGERYNDKKKKKKCCS